MKPLNYGMGWKYNLIAALALLTGAALAAVEFRSVMQNAEAASSEEIDSQTNTSASQSTTTREALTSSVGTATQNDKLAECYSALANARKLLTNMDDYSASFHLRERLDGKLSDWQRVALRIRHEPFSVRMTWSERGRDAVFVEGKHDNQLLVAPGGRAALLGILELDPEGETAMATSRYPITSAGMLALVNKLMNYIHPLLTAPSGMTCERSSDTCHGEACDRFDIAYENASICDGYAKTIMRFSRSSGLLMSIENHRFQTTSRSGTVLAEQYLYTNIEPDVGLSDEDFTLPQNGVIGRFKAALSGRQAAND